MSTRDTRPLRIYLVGFMGAGKTSVGECLARELRWPFVDLDREIERATGRTIEEIFRDDGEPVFRRLEAATLRAVAAAAPLVVACGGGTLTVPESRDLVRRTGVTVWLDAPLDVMIARCLNGPRRPLLADRSRMEALLGERLPAYRAANLSVDASTDSPAAIAERILGLLADLR